MRQESSSRARASVAGSITARRAIGTLRSAYFAQAGESAMRYGISFDRVVRHLWEARRCNRNLLVSSVECIDDLVHAIACVDNVGLAWADLTERYERALVRRGRSGQDEMEATVFVRRLFADLRRRDDEAFDPIFPSLRCYVGNRPLRNWLADRLNAARARGRLAFGHDLAAMRRSLHSAPPLVLSQGIAEPALRLTSSSEAALPPAPAWS